MFVVISIEQLQILCKNIYTCFAVYMYSFLLDVNLRVKLLINRVCICSALVDSAKLSRMGVPNYIPTSKVTVLVALRFLSVLGIVGFFNFNPFSWIYSQMFEL